MGTAQNTKVQFNDFLWSTLETAHPYMVVTEQFRHEDGVYYYSAFENGIHKEWKVCDTHEYPEGVYVLDKITANTGVRLKEYPQELIFANQLAGVMHRTVFCSMERLPIRRAAFCLSRTLAFQAPIRHAILQALMSMFQFIAMIQSGAKT